MPESGEVASERAQQLLTAAETAQLYAFWVKRQKPFGITIDPDLQKLVNGYGGSGDKELADHFLNSVALAEAALDEADQLS